MRSNVQLAAITGDFTLIEMCVVLCLAVMLISVAMPSLGGQLSRRRLQDASDRLEVLATRARERSVSEGQAYQLVWEKGGAHRPLSGRCFRRRTAQEWSAERARADGGERALHSGPKRLADRKPCPCLDLLALG